jgi:hypothetical protein
VFLPDIVPLLLEGLESNEGISQQLSEDETGTHFNTHYHTHMLSQYHSITLSHYHSITVSHYHTITHTHTGAEKVVAYILKYSEYQDLLNDDDSEEDGEEDDDGLSSPIAYTVGAAFVDEKTQALHSLAVIARSTGPHFIPYFSSSLSLSLCLFLFLLH